jgi:serine/threonine protein kinase/Tol biopolymer transport system component
MPLSNGADLGSYKILALLGTGGMGEVYRARDSKLKREVALKVLPLAFAQDAERLSRFRREAQALAALNHPNIAAIYSLEDSANVHFLTMEYVPGAQLRGPLPLDEAMAISHQMADALEAAHEKGIVHRDLKPANVHVMSDGKVKILDFGLAKFAAAAGENAATETEITQDGIVLGTLAYMSPEQAQGQQIDKRTDIWAFGCVLYELLTGRPAFYGKTTAEVITAILCKDPDWGALPAGSPVLLLRRCLQKEPKERLRDIGDAFLIEAVETAAAPIARPRLRAWVVGSVVALILVLSGLWLARSRPAISPPYRKVVIASQGTLNAPSLSPDGRKIAYVATDILYVRDLSQIDPQRVDDAVASPLTSPFWSPDSRWIGYSTGKELRIVAAGGGPGRTLCKTAGSVQGAAWTDAWDPRGEIVYAVNANGIFRVSADGGEPLKIVDNVALKTYDFHGVVFMHRSGDFLTWAHSGTGAGTAGNWIRVSGQGSQTHKVESSLTRRGTGAWSPAGFFLISDITSGGLWSIRWDGSNSGWGHDRRLVDRFGQNPSVSADGSLLYLRVIPGNDQLVMVDRGGHILRELGQPVTDITAMKVSPDGERVAFESTSGVWIFNFSRENSARLVNDVTHAGSPHWSSEGKTLGFVGDDSGEEGSRLYIQPADSSASPEPSVAVWRDWDWSPDRDQVVYSGQKQGNSRDIFLTSRKSGATFGIATTPSWEDKPEIDPSGRYLAYQSDENGRTEIYVRSLGGGSGKWLVSANSGRFPHWSRGGTELFYLEGETLMSAKVSTLGTFHVDAPPAKLFSNDPGHNFTMQEFTPMADGRRFLMVRPVGDQHRAILLVENWQLGLSEKSP